MKNVIRLQSYQQKIKVLQDLTKIVGVPVINIRLSVFTDISSPYTFTINFINNECELKLGPEKVTLCDKYLKLKNNNIKTLFQIIDRLGYKKGYIGEVIEHSFTDGENKISILSESFIGDIIQTKIENQLTWSRSEACYYLNELSHSEEYLKNTDNDNLELLIDKFGVLNEKIVSFANKVGLDIRSGNQTISHRLNNKSNDYSYLNKPFFEVTNSNLISRTSIKESFKLNSTSIIIPAYNSENTILKTLYSIESQKIDHEDMQKIQVIIVDDGSIVPLKEILNNFLEDFSFNCDLIRIEKNRGVATARNIGYDVSKGSNIIFLDSDLILPDNFLREVLIRIQLVQNAVFVSFKNNVDINDRICDLEEIKKGIKVPERFDDMRVNRIISENIQEGVVEYMEILADSDYFKSMGHGRKINGFDLASMVIGHNISLTRSIIDQVNKFERDFVGWGMEDTYFGAKLITGGNFVIPILSTGVYHINHKARSGAENKQKEFDNNLNTYNYLIDKPINNE